ncbi:MAG: Fe-S protein assembly co-chaperone HscB [Phycisphaeraceae bacterium]
MSTDPFATLGVDRRFDLDTESLRQTFLAASARAHPDQFVDPIDQADAVDRMSRLTDAFRVLSDPESRARALLGLSGLEAECDRDKLPPDLLMEVMEVREEMESAIVSGDAAELDRLRTWANERRAEHLNQLKTLFATNLDADAASRVRLELNALRYMQRMLDQMPG